MPRISGSIRLTGKKLPAEHLGLSLKGQTFDRGVEFVERVQVELDVSLVDFLEEVLDAFFILHVVQNDEAVFARGHEGGDVPAS